jgi:valyl-tRNA synthetase
MRFSPEKIESARNFANKLWNASRFVLMNLTDEEMPLELPDASALAKEDKWVLTRFNTLVREVTDAVDRYELGVALAAVYDFTWDILCDWYIELCKSRLYGEDATAADTARRVLVYTLRGTLKLLHPYMPFITEEIYSALPYEDESIMISAYPKYDEALNFATDAEEMERIIGSITAIRVRRAEMNVPPSRRANLFVVTRYPETYEKAYPFFERLASAASLTLVDAYEKDDAVSIVTDAATVYIPLADMIDFEKERARLEADLAKVEADIARTEGKLANESFVAKAPAAVVDAERQKIAKFQAAKEALEAELAKLK